MEQMVLGSYPDPANSTSKYSDSVLGGKCLPGYSLQQGTLLVMLFLLGKFKLMLFS